VIIVGHTRLKAAVELQLKTVPVHVAKDLTAAQVKAYRLADNATNEIAEWEKNLLPRYATRHGALMPILHEVQHAHRHVPYQAMIEIALGIILGIMLLAFLINLILISIRCVSFINLIKAWTWYVFWLNAHN
jgi:hypothetical protein